MNDLNLDKVKLLKLEAEGFEPEILRGAGDRLKDIEAGKNAGCKTIYLNKIGLDIADYHVKNHKELKDLISVLLT